MNWAYDAAKARLAKDEETVPAAVAFALLEGEPPLVVWRRHRGLTQQQLASVGGISTAYLSQLETGKRQGTVEVLGRLAAALGIELDDLT